MNINCKRGGIVPWLWLVVMGIVFAIVAFCHFPEGTDWGRLLPLQGRYHILLILSGTAVSVLIAWLTTLLCRSTELHKRRLWIISILLAIVQTIAVYSYYFHSDWDVQLVTGAAKAMAEGDSVDFYRDYYQWNPNNLLLTRFFAFVFWLTGPLWGGKVVLFPLLFLQSVASWIAGLMLFQLSMHINGRKVNAVVCYVFYYLLVGFSPWWSIPYSDVWGLLIVVTLLWMAFILPFKRQWLRIFIFAIVTTLGYYIKPQTFFVALSVAIVYLVQRFKVGEGLKDLRRPLSIALGGILVGVMLAHATIVGCPFHLHTGRALGVPHFLMMGANRYSIGIYSVDDVNFSRQYVNKSKRSRADMQETFRRYSELGVKGTAELWGWKNLLNFSDGTFYWGLEGDFYKIMLDKGGDRKQGCLRTITWSMAKMTRNLFYNRSQKGQYYDAWCVAATALWFGILLFALLAAVPAFKRHSNTVVVVMLILLCVIAFHTLCEARARYLFSFAPLFILLASTLSFPSRRQDCSD